MIKTIIFDFDGTLADSLKTVLKIVNSLSEKYNYILAGKEPREPDDDLDEVCKNCTRGFCEGCGCMD